MTRALACVCLMSLAACGYSEESYLEDEAAAACTFTVDCYPGLYDSVDECITLRGEPVVTAGCAYDAQAAADCVDGLEAMSCPEEGAAPAFPVACDSVYGECDGA